MYSQIWYCKTVRFIIKATLIVYVYQSLKWPPWVSECEHVNSAPLSCNNRNDCMGWGTLSVCVCVCVPHLHRCNHTSFLHRHEEEILQYSHSALWKWQSTQYIPNLKSYCLHPVYHFLFIIRHWSMWCVQSASQAVSGSDQVVWPSGEPRGRQWPHCVAEVPLVSLTLPATETGRSKMAECREPCWCLSWFKQGSFDPFLEAAFLRGLMSELGGLKRGGKAVQRCSG